ncbi:MAG: UvrD-helicase domain-containing protein [Synergistaceae bacterium]|jgi:ATP-dependent exoDNAse (exonuclease V) beta subunit|nr:UvrD-helicase domain-containing protein [Synergistaceae bacterium]
MNEASLSGLVEDAREEQRLAICSRAPLIVVSAGAGTGKTHTLARRFAWLLASDPDCKVDQILTLTFTQLAASEMRERIRGTLKSWHRADTPHLRDAIDRVDEAYISTIHSYALRVIRESGLELDIDPRSSIIGAPSEREFWNDLRWSAATRPDGRLPGKMPDEWEKYALSLFSDPGYPGLINYFGARELASLGRDSCELFGSMNRRPEDMRDFDPRLELAARERVASFLEGRWFSAWDEWQDRVFPSIGRFIDEPDAGNLPSALRGVRDRWRGAERSRETCRGFFADLVNNALSNLSGGKRAFKDAIEGALGKNLKEWRDERRGDAEVSATLFASPPYGEDEARVRRLLLAIAATFWKCWDSVRGELGALTFSDLVRYAGDVLAASKSYAARFRHIMVDEFQDTDELQDNMIGSLVRAWGDAGGPDGGTRTLFIVGDIKQSIYRFRHANPRLLARYAAAPEALGIPLSHSYRMSGRLMDGINMVFGHIWRDGVLEDADLRARYEPLLPPSDAPWWEERNGPDAPESPLEILVYPPAEEAAEGRDKKPEGPREDAKSRRMSLAGGLAARLREMSAGGTVVWDRKTTAFRPARWRDMAVLVPTRTPYREIELAFAREGVPVVFGSGREYFNRSEVRDIVGLLRLLDNPDDETALAGWMESPLSGLPPGTALCLAESARAAGSTLRDVFSREFGEHAARESKLRRTARLLGPSEALCALTEDGSWLDAYGAESRARVRANVRTAIDMAREYESSFGKLLPPCASYLEREMRGGEGAFEPDASREDIDAVRAMTVHASKGLEFPIVAIMGMEASPTGRRGGVGGRVSVSRQLGVVASRLPDGSASVTAKWHAVIERAEEMDESARLMYVAMTRAQDYLLCCGVLKRSLPSGGDWLGLLMEANDANGGPLPVTALSLRGVAARHRASPEPAKGAAQDALKAVPSGVPFRPRLARMSASAFSLISWCPAAYRARYRQGRALKWEMPDGDGYGGADLGSVAHWVLSRWDFDANSLTHCLPLEGGRELEDTLREMPAPLRHACGPQSNRKIILAWLGAFAATEAGNEMRSLRRAGALRRELAFSVRHAGTNLVGSIDAYWEDERGGHVRDWKITSRESAPEELYEAQMLFYAMACHIARPKLDVDVGIIFLRNDRLIGPPPVKIKKIDNWNDIGKNISTAAETALKGPFEGELERCESCPFKHDCDEANNCTLKI